MKRAGLALLAAPLLAMPARAQYLVPPSPPITRTPLAPAAPASPPAPGLNTPAPSTPAPITLAPDAQIGATSPQDQPQTLPTTPPMTQPPAPGPDIWLPRAVADVQALDKINARVQTLSLRLGIPEKFGSLALTLRACMVRPADQPQDSAAFLEIVDSHADQPGFRGWMFASEPEVSMLESAVYDIRLNACRS